MSIISHFNAFGTLQCGKNARRWRERSLQKSAQFSTRCPHSLTFELFHRLSSLTDIANAFGHPWTGGFPITSVACTKAADLFGRVVEEVLVEDMEECAAGGFSAEQQGGGPGWGRAGERGEGAKLSGRRWAGGSSGPGGGKGCFDRDSHQILSPLPELWSLTWNSCASYLAGAALSRPIGATGGNQGSFTLSRSLLLLWPCRIQQ